MFPHRVAAFLIKLLISEQQRYFDRIVKPNQYVATMDERSQSRIR